MHLDIATLLPCSVEVAAAEIRRPPRLHYVAWPLVVFRPCPETPWPAQWLPGTYWASMRLLGILPLGRQAIVISYPPSAGFALRDNGHSRWMRRWDHLIALESHPQGCVYRDRLSIDAGVFTLPVWLFAQVFYRYRQYRWRRLARRGFAGG